MHFGFADGRSGPAARAAHAARCWLARSAAGVRLICNQTKAAAATCTSLVYCLPALEDVELKLCAPLYQEDLGCLLEALAWSPRLRTLDLSMRGVVAGYKHLHWPFPAPALANLSSLTSLALTFHRDPYPG